MSSSVSLDALLDTAAKAADELDQTFQLQCNQSSRAVRRVIDPAILREKFRLVNEYIETNEKFRRWMQHQTEMLIDIQSTPDPSLLLQQLKEAVQKAFTPPAVRDLIDPDLQAARQALNPALHEARRAWEKLLVEAWAVLEAATGKTDKQGTVDAVAGAVTVTSAYLDVMLLPAKLLREQYMADLQRPPTSTDAQPPAPAQPVKQVFISQGQQDFSLQADGAQPISVPTDYSKIVVLFVSKVMADAPCEVVAWPALNQAVGEQESTKATAVLRKELLKLNEHLRNALGKPPSGGHWIQSVKGRGARLTPSVSWRLGQKLKKLRSSSSVYSHSVKPEILAEAVPDPAHKLPARPRRAKSSYYDDEDFDD